MQKTNIQYLDYSWSPIAMRCTPIAAGCKNCWHLRMADRLKNNPLLPDHIKTIYAGKDSPLLLDNRLRDPYKCKKPARIGVQFMGDLWHKDISFEKIDKVAATIALCPHHIFLCLTKRPERMKEYLNNYYRAFSVTKTSDKLIVMQEMKKMPKEIRQEYIGHWHFVDNGKFTPGFEVENLARAWEAKNGKMFPKYP